MIDRALEVQAPDEVIQQVRDALHELEREVIMLTFKFAAPTGKYKNEIREVAHIGLLTVHSTRDSMFMNNLKHGIKQLNDFLSRDQSYITLKRIKVFRQRYNAMVHTNQNAGRSRSTSAWNRKSAAFLAGKVLSGILNEHIPRSLFTAAPY